MRNLSIFINKQNIIIFIIVICLGVIPSLAYFQGYLLKYKTEAILKIKNNNISNITKLDLGQEIVLDLNLKSYMLEKAAKTIDNSVNFVVDNERKLVKIWLNYPNPKMGYKIVNSYIKIFIEKYSEQNIFLEIVSKPEISQKPITWKRNIAVFGNLLSWIIFAIIIVIINSKLFIKKQK